MSKRYKFNKQQFEDLIKKEDKVTKNDISKIFNTLRNLGAIVLKFQTNKYLPQNARGMTDLLIIYNDRMYYLEIKINDKLSPEQLEFQRSLKPVCNATGYYVSYAVLTRYNYQIIFANITSKKGFFITK